MNILEYSNVYNFIYYEKCILKNRFTGDEKKWLDFLKYMIKEDKELNLISNWPEGFLNDNLINSLKINFKFNL